MSFAKQFQVATIDKRTFTLPHLALEISILYTVFPLQFLVPAPVLKPILASFLACP